MKTKSNDIYYKIFRLMSLNIDIKNLSKYSKEEIVAAYLSALIIYTNSKLYELTHSLEVYSNFKTLIEKFYPYFEDNQEREFFYQQFGHSMLNIIGNIEQQNIVWYSIKEGPFASPVFISKENNTDFLTLQEQSNKDIIIWLYDYLNKTYINQVKLTKKD